MWVWILIYYGKKKFCLSVSIDLVEKRPVYTWWTERRKCVQWSTETLNQTSVILFWVLGRNTWKGNLRCWKVVEKELNSPGKRRKKERDVSFDRFYDKKRYYLVLNDQKSIPTLPHHQHLHRHNYRLNPITSYNIKILNNFLWCSFVQDNKQQQNMLVLMCVRKNVINRDREFESYKSTIIHQHSHTQTHT